MHLKTFWLVVLLCAGQTHAHAGEPATWVSPEAYFHDAMLLQLCHDRSAGAHAGLDEYRNLLKNYYHRKLPHGGAAFMQLEQNHIPQHIDQRLSAAWANSTPAERKAVCTNLDRVVEIDVSLAMAAIGEEAKDQAAIAAAVARMQAAKQAGSQHRTHLDR